jgi:hypothetical protein
MEKKQVFRHGRSDVSPAAVNPSFPAHIEWTEVMFIALLMRTGRCLNQQPRFSQLNTGHLTMTASTEAGPGSRHPSPR